MVHGWCGVVRYGIVDVDEQGAARPATLGSRPSPSIQSRPARRGSPARDRRAPSTILRRPAPIWSVTASRWRSIPTSTGCLVDPATVTLLHAPRSNFYIDAADKSWLEAAMSAVGEVLAEERKKMRAEL